MHAQLSTDLLCNQMLLYPVAADPFGTCTGPCEQSSRDSPFSFCGQVPFDFSIVDALIWQDRCDKTT